MPSAPANRVNLILSVLGLLILSTGVVYAVRGLTREKIEVRTAQVTYQDIINTVSTNGKVEPIHEFQAHASVAGQVEKVYVEVGQKVQSGTLLIKLDDSDAVSRIASCKANFERSSNDLTNIQGNGSQEARINAANELRNAQLQQQQASRDLASLQQLQAKGAASVSEVASARQRLDVADATLDNVKLRGAGRYSGGDIRDAQQQVENAKAICQAAQTSFNGANIRSPIAGTVYSIPVSQYDFVPAGDDLLDVADLDKIRVRAYFDEPEIGKLEPGQPVKITWDAKPNLSWHGHIDLAPTTVISYGTRNVGEAVITVDDAHGDLQPNSNVTVSVITLQRMHVLSVPREALHTDQGNSYVYMVKNNKLQRTPVQLGDAVNLTRVQIASGISEDAVVALDATTNHDLTDGLDIKTVKQ